jgi:hypothetical protein
VQAYLDDRRGKGYSVSDGMGPLTAAWRAAAQQTTTITEVAADATTKLYNDGGNNTGVGGSANASFGSVVDLVNLVGNNASTEPAKRFYKYARPYRWSSSVVVLPALVPAKSSTRPPTAATPAATPPKACAIRSPWPTRCRSASRKWSAAASSSANRASWPACTRRWT